MKKNITVFIAVVVAVLAAGCRTAEQPDKNGAGLRRRTVVIEGSTSMEKVIGFLSEAFMEENSAIKINFNPTGSTAGIQAVREGRCAIGLTSRSLKNEEKTMLKDTVIAIDGIVVVVNPENTVKNLTVAQVAAIYTGEITNWKDVGGRNGPVVLIGREAASGTREGFEAITGTENACKYNQELTSSGDVLQTVAGNPNAVGYISLASVKNTVNKVDINGVEATAETIRSGLYKIQRDFIMVTKSDVKLSESAQAFFDFATGAGADALIEKAGAVPPKR